jgi:hypothetical protein
VTREWQDVVASRVRGVLREHGYDLVRSDRCTIEFRLEDGTRSILIEPNLAEKMMTVSWFRGSSPSSAAAAGDPALLRARLNWRFRTDPWDDLARVAEEGVRHLLKNCCFDGAFVDRTLNILTPILTQFCLFVYERDETFLYDLLTVSNGSVGLQIERDVRDGDVGIQFLRMVNGYSTIWEEPQFRLSLRDLLKRRAPGEQYPSGEVRGVFAEDEFVRWGVALIRLYAQDLLQGDVTAFFETSSE